MFGKELVQQSATASNIRKSIVAFLQWMEENGYHAYDPYNLWSTQYGIWAKSLYQRNKALGLPAIAPILLGDILAPRLSRIFSSKHRFPISDAHCIISYCSLYKLSGKREFLEEAVILGEELLAQSLHESHSCHCWGYPFDWQTNQGYGEAPHRLLQQLLIVSRHSCPCMILQRCTLYSDL